MEVERKESQAPLKITPGVPFNLNLEEFQQNKENVTGILDSTTLLSCKFELEGICTGTMHFVKDAEAFVEHQDDIILPEGEIEVRYKLSTTSFEPVLDDLPVELFIRFDVPVDIHEQEGEVLEFECLLSYGEAKFKQSYNEYPGRLSSEDQSTYPVDIYDWDDVDIGSCKLMFSPKKDVVSNIQIQINSRVNPDWGRKIE